MNPASFHTKKTEPNQAPETRCMLVTPAENPRVLAQKDTDARWTIKGKEPYYGYKNHVKVDETSKLVVDYTVTPASTNDGKILPN